MGFVQIMEFTTGDVSGFRALEQEFVTATEGKRPARRSVLARDRANPDHYFALVFFDSYESAMTNSNLPETQTIGAKMDSAVGGLTFHDFDVVSELDL